VIVTRGSREVSSKPKSRPTIVEELQDPVLGKARPSEVLILKDKDEERSTVTCLFKRSRHGGKKFGQS